ncbi:PREDICTED: inactive glucose-1-phosphate adenylyltransferase small subunit 2, chloroplastic-like [Nelumbo nucifera]|uniref:Inactive glucose-1-phosphate adenylyltransferase small subunit 2, chloroplastic-like n=2 Tax=Nelumbo nucifera TaxID=4432 RepID=A0A1U8B9J1_NELNU|nr:PREDICTED: inactive glucose-1-phosphate adenylyltransferase small subunit 2, chloroplastic-like [Nelumbo nucifera]DAD25085.1 TPA_asm: hypothetical protein HUJ06_026549 [Nelumbo nucifera]
MWQVSLPTSASYSTALPVLGLVHGHKKPPLNLPCTARSSMCVSSSQDSEYPTTQYPSLNQSVAAIVFGDGSESRLYPLTKRRSKGAIPIAANYRLIDVVMSNCINSNITKIYALTQFNSTSLNSHLSRAYSGVGLGKDGFVEVIAAYQSPEEKDWFQGTADAVRRCLWVLEEYPVDEFLILPGHHLYNMNYQRLIKAHRSSNADITIAVSSTTIGNHDPGFGFLNINSENQVVEFKERPEREPVDFMAVDSSRKSEDGSTCDLGSMGIYVIKREVMTKLLTECFPKANDFTTEIIPGAISMGMKVRSYLFDGYWEDMNSIKSFYRANMECTKKETSGFNFYDRDSPVYTLPRYLPPTLVTGAHITDSIIGDGCILNSCRIKGSVIGMRTWIGDAAVVEDSMIMGSDVYQGDRRIKEINGMEIPIGIGKSSHIRKAIIDKNARIGKNVKIINKDNVQEGDREAFGYFISEGIVIVLRSAVIPDESII